MPNTRTADRIRRNIDRPKFSATELRQKLDDWRGLRRQEKSAKADAEKLKSEFKALVEKFGVKDENGSLFVEIEPPVGPIVAIKNQRNVTPTTNEEEAIAILKKKGMYQEPYVVMVPKVDYDAIRGAIFEKLLTRSESSRIFGSDESYSFYALDINGKPVTG